MSRERENARARGMKKTLGIAMVKKQWFTTNAPTQNLREFSKVRLPTQTLDPRLSSLPLPLCFISASPSHWAHADPLRHFVRPLSLYRAQTLPRCLSLSLRTGHLPVRHTLSRFQISTLAIKLGVRNIALLGTSLLLANYVVAISVAFYIPQDLGKSLLDCEKDKEEELEEETPKAEVEESEDCFVVPDGYFSEDRAVEDEVVSELHGKSVTTPSASMVATISDSDIPEFVWLIKSCPPCVE